MAYIRKKYKQKNQSFSEKVKRVNDQVELGDDIQRMEAKTDRMNKIVVGLQEKTEKYLEEGRRIHSCGSPTIERNSVGDLSPSKSRGNMLTAYGRHFIEMQNSRTEITSGHDKNLGESLIDFGDSLEQMSDYKNALETTVKQSFLEPLELILTKDFSEVLFHRRKLEKRRLDYDYK